MSVKSTVVATLAFFSLTATVSAEILENTFGTGGDVVVRRGNSTENDGFLRIKNQSGDAESSGNDRIGLIKFDLSGLSETINESLLRLELPRGASTGQAGNTFDPGNELFLYGVPDGGADENFDEGAVTFGSFPYLTGVDSVTDPRPATDITGNSINDDLAVLLDTFVFNDQPDAGDLVNFRGPDLTAFLQADTNNIATFILGVSQSDAFKTAVFVSDTGTEGTPIPPTLLTNADVPLMGTDFDMMNGTDLDDFEILRSNYLTGTTFSQGDANLDGTVNHEDFYMWRTDFLAMGGNPALVSFNPIPEPSAGLLCCCLTLGLLRRSRGR